MLPQLIVWRTLCYLVSRLVPQEKGKKGKKEKEENSSFASGQTTASRLMPTIWHVLKHTNKSRYQTFFRRLFYSAEHGTRRQNLKNNKKLSLRAGKPNLRADHSRRIPSRVRDRTFWQCCHRRQPGRKSSAGSRRISPSFPCQISRNSNSWSKS